MATRRDFVAAAATIKWHREHHLPLFDPSHQPQAERMLDSIAEDFVLTFKSQNPRFDAARFYRAAGVEAYQ